MQQTVAALKRRRQLRGCFLIVAASESRLTREWFAVQSIICVGPQVGGYRILVQLAIDRGAHCFFFPDLDRTKKREKGAVLCKWDMALRKRQHPAGHEEMLC